MQNQPSNNKNVLMAAVLIVVLVGAYFVFFKGEDSGEVLVQQSASGEIMPGMPGMPGAEGEMVPGADLLPFLLQLNSLKLDKELFNDEVFLSLKDYTVTIVDQPVGRSNPFAPLGREVKPAETTTGTKLPSIRLPRR